MKYEKEGATQKDKFLDLGEWWTVIRERDVPHVVLLLLGEFQSVAEDLERRLFITTESTCLGRLTVDTEHLPKKPTERHTDVYTCHSEKRRGKRGELQRRHELCSNESSVNTAWADMLQK